MNAWSALEVFQLSLLTSLLEIRQFAQFIIGNRCDQINQILIKLDSLHIIDLDKNDKCFDVVNTLLMGCLLLFISSILYIIIGTFLLRICQSSLNQRIALQEKVFLQSQPINSDLQP